MTQSDKKEKDKEMRKAESYPKGETVKPQGCRQAEILWRGGCSVPALRRVHLVYLQAGHNGNGGRDGWHQYNDTRAIAPETMTDKQKAYELERMKKAQGRKR